MSESDSPVGKLCDVCETEIRAEPEIYQLGIQDRKTDEVVIVPVPTEVWCCDCGPGGYEDAFAFKINEAECEYHGDPSPSRLKEKNNESKDKGSL